MHDWGIDAQLHHSNYVSVLDDLGGDTKVLGWLCAESPPWARTDAAIVRESWARSRGERGEDLKRCPVSDAEGPSDREMGIRVVSEGAGAAVDEGSFVRVRAQRIRPATPEAPYTAERYAEPARLYVRHVGCLPFAAAVLRLEVGGVAEMRVTDDGAGRVWRVELLEVGGESLLARDLGLDEASPVRAAPEAGR